MKSRKTLQSIAMGIARTTLVSPVTTGEATPTDDQVRNSVYTSVRCLAQGAAMGLIAVSLIAVAEAADNGLPTSVSKQFKLLDNNAGYTTYETPKGNIVSFNPSKAQVVKINGRYEAVLREDAGTEGVLNNKQRFEYDSGLPVSEASKFGQVFDATTSPEWRTYVTPQGETVSFNPTTSRLWRNKNKNSWEPIIRETSKQDLIAQVERDRALKRLDAELARQARNRSASVFVKGVGNVLVETGKVGLDVSMEVLEGLADALISYGGSGGSSYGTSRKTRKIQGSHSNPYYVTE